MLLNNGTRVERVGVEQLACCCISAVQRGGGVIASAYVCYRLRIVHVTALASPSR